MAYTCSWCGTDISFFNTRYVGLTVRSKAHYICGDCLQKINDARNGCITFEKIATENTDPNLYDYFCSQVEGISEDEKYTQEQRQAKKKAQQTDPLYDDIHQIAGDLRFIKNYLVFTIILGIILGLIAVISAGN